MNFTTLIIGASDNPERYSYKAANALHRKGFPFVMLGLKEFELLGQKSLTGFPDLKDIDTVTLYVGQKNLPPFFDYIVKLNPRRVIFNPGTENPELIALLKKNNIEPVIACTLVMLSIGDF